MSKGFYHAKEFKMQILCFFWLGYIFEEKMPCINFGFCEGNATSFRVWKTVDLFYGSKTLRKTQNLAYYASKMGIKRKIMLDKTEADS